MEIYDVVKKLIGEIEPVGASHIDMEIYDVVKKLIGEIEPVGASHIDGERFENLKNMTQLVKELLTDIECVRDDNSSMHEDSIRKAVDHVRQFHDDIGLT